MLLGLISLFVHLLVCLAIFLGMVAGPLKAPMLMMPVVIFVPLFGALCALMLHFRILFYEGRAVELGVERMQIHEDIYRSIFVPDAEQEGVAPLEDVLLLGETKTRRRQMLKLMNSDPTRYLDLFREARMNTDVEVVHYATTAMSELNKDYDLKLQQAEKAYGDDPENPQQLDAYLEVLGEYLQLAMAPERVQKIQREQYAMLLEKRQLQRPSLENGAELVRQQLMLGQFEDADGALLALEQAYPEEQQVWLLRLEYAARMHDGSRIQHILKEAKEKNIFFSAQASQTLAFWEEEQP